MNDHPEKSLLSAYVDQALVPAENAAVSRHIAQCAACRAEAGGLEGIKKRLAGAARRAMPIEILQDIEDRLRRPTWTERLAAFFAAPRLWLPAGAAAALLAAGVWWGLGQSPDKNAIPLEALLASHARYESEGLLPQNDLFNSNFSAQVDSYHADSE